MIGKAARLLGIVFVAVGILGFVPQATPNGLLLGIFPVSTWHNVAHLVLGLWGLSVGASFAGAVRYMRSLTAIYALLAVLGLIASTSNLFGVIPLHGPDVWLHAGLAVVAAYFGFGPPSRGGVVVA
ncbi:MAG TPA: DUF4383 domain-containing protein [Gemmatimonadales bacterium]|jgi:hypothetical protein|nr:DUF4383 domain-containing protein [Gemmatimonadales bacterium]